MLRRRRGQIVNAVQQLDAFPKVEESIKEKKSTHRGACVIVTILISLWLLHAEVLSYFNSRFKYKFSVDSEFDSRFQLNVDITVAMSCELIGTDVMDSTDQPIMTMGKLEPEPTTFEMSERQRHYWDMLKNANVKQQRRPNDNTLESVFWIAGAVIRKLDKENEERSKVRGRKDACRIHGSVGINKVAGNFHISVGKTLVLGGNVHAHLSFMLSEDMYNFSHRIEHFSFGKRVNEMVHTLDGTEKIADKSMTIFQYYTHIVPIKIHYKTHAVDTYQYSVTFKNRTVDHNKGSHGVPGLFFKYDFSGMSVDAFEDRQSPIQFLVRLCAIVGGIYATSALVQLLIQCIIGCFTCWRRKSPSIPYEGLANMDPVPQPPLAAPPVMNNQHSSSDAHVDAKTL